ncbi:histone H1 [Sphingobacterium sp. ML3W]|uniref:histone H1 n=1 Tax=Sphingobacterium sp. ML3W TaxID=1538644 RepID=UPI0004F7FC49|nr:histone H1 [Sphingobacterium sp. ML3W]AIM37384.1 histone H1 [Sphingobacterium sp. ML3W]
MTNFKKLEETFLEAKQDHEKFENGNKTAGTRVRNHMQKLKSIAQDIRNEVLAKKKSA